MRTANINKGLSEPLECLVWDWALEAFYVKSINIIENGCQQTAMLLVFQSGLCSLGWVTHALLKMRCSVVEVQTNAGVY